MIFPSWKWHSFLFIFSETLTYIGQFKITSSLFVYYKNADFNNYRRLWTSEHHASFISPGNHIKSILKNTKIIFLAGKYSNTFGSSCLFFLIFSNFQNNSEFHASFISPGNHLNLFKIILKLFQSLENTLTLLNFWYLALLFTLFFLLFLLTTSYLSYFLLNLILLIIFLIVTPC